MWMISHLSGLNEKTNSIKTKEPAYKRYVRPKVDYCSVVWDPWQKQQINKIEMIQRRAERNDWAPDLKASKSGLLATWFGSEFHNLIVLGKNEYK
jgi:hypothetical protein